MLLGVLDPASEKTSNRHLERAVFWLARRLIAPFLTASITRSRKSCEYGFGIPAGLRPANRLNQNVPDSGIPTLDSIASKAMSPLQCRGQSP